MASGRPGSGPPRARSPPCRERRRRSALALIGSGIKMSMAKAFHELAGALSGIEVTYDLIDRDAASRADVPRLIGRCRDDGYAALNVTYPFKEIAFGCVVVDDPSVQHIGAVNTIVFGDGGPPVGSNTDFSGLLRRWRLRWPDERPGVVALIGAGGVGRSTAFALGELGASAIRIADVEPDRVAALADALDPTVPGSAGHRGGDGRVRRRWCRRRRQCDAGRHVLQPGRAGRPRRDRRPTVAVRRGLLADRDARWSFARMPPGWLC